MTLPQMLQALQAINPSAAAALTARVQAHISALEQALPVEHQYFVLGRAGVLAEFLRTDEGKVAVRAFVDAWVQSANKPLSS